MADVFPSLARKPDVSIVESYDDPALRSKMENGLIITRARYNSARRTFSISYSHAPQADADALSNFVRKTTFGGAGSFLWEDPRTGEEIECRFTEMPQIIDAGWATQKPDRDTNGNITDGAGVSGLTYNFAIRLEEV